MPDPRPYPNPDAISRVNGADPSDPGDDLAAYRAYMTTCRRSRIERCVGAHRAERCLSHPPVFAVSAPDNPERTRFAIVQVNADGTFLWDEWAAFPDHVRAALEGWAEYLTTTENEELVVAPGAHERIRAARQAEAVSA